MKIKFIFLFFIIAAKLFSQETDVYKPLTAMTSDDKLKYDLLQKCVLKKSENPDKVHFFSEYSVAENDHYIDFKSIIYDNPTFGYCRFSTSSCTYSVYIRFMKIKKTENIDNSTGYGTGESGEERATRKKIKPNYYLAIYDALKESSFNNEPILSLNDEKPFFDNKFEKVFFMKSGMPNKVDKTIYKQNLGTVSYINSEFIIVKKGELYGIVNPKNKVLVPFEFQYITPTTYGLMIQKTENSRWFINSKNEKISETYEKIDFNFACNNHQLNQYLFVKKDGFVNLIDLNFKTYLKNNYTKISTFKSTSTYPLQILASTEKQQVIIDSDTFEETNIKYDEITNIDDKLLLVKLNSKFGIVNRENAAILKIEYDEIKITFDTYMNCFFVLQYQGKYGIANKNGKIVKEVKYSSIEFLTKTQQFECKNVNEIELFESQSILK